MTRRLGVLRLPALEPSERVILARRIRDRDERHLVADAAADPFARDGATRGAFAFRLAEVRRPRRIARARLLRRAPRARAARRASRRASSMSACGSPIAANRSGTREHREVRRIARGHLVPAQRRRHARVGQRPDGIRRAGRAILGVLVVVEEDALAFFLPPLRRRERGARRSISRENASAARRTSVNVQRCSMRTLTCMPRDPLVFGQPRSPSSSSNAFASIATRRTSSHSTPGPGSRSMRSSSG